MGAECQPLHLAGPLVLGDRHLRVRHGRRRRRRWWGGRRSEPAAWGWVAAWRALVAAAARWEPARRRSSPPVRAWAAIRVRGAAARWCACGLSTQRRLTQSHPNPLSSSQENEWLSEEHVCRRHSRAQGFWAAANTASRASRAKQVGRILWSVTRSWGGGRRRSRPVQRGRRVGGTRVVWGHRHGGRQQAAARAIRTQGMGGTPVDAGIHRARKESVCVRAQPVVQARRWRAFVCLWPRECVAQP